MTAAVAEEHLIGPHTVDEWNQLPEQPDGSRIELIWGYWHVSPAPAAPHQNACYRICRAIDDAIAAAGRDDVHVVQAVGVDISTAMRYGLIPDVAVLNEPLIKTSFPPEALRLAVEVWSPSNNKRERETKIAGYALAGVPYLWTFEFKREWHLEVRGFILDRGSYRQVVTNRKGDTTVELPGPIPVTLDLPRLLPPR